MRNLKENSMFLMALKESDINTDFNCSIEHKDLLNEYQGKTSFCWLYSGVALLKQYMRKHYGIENYDFSYAYLMFWDKYERMQYAIDAIYSEQYLDDALDLNFLCGDKGNYEILVDLINKYGIVPRETMPDTFCVKVTNDLNYVLNNYLINLIKDRETLRKISKEKAIKEIYDLLSDCYGTPTESFDVDIQEKENITPNYFYEKYLNKCLNDYITIANYSNDEEYIDKYCCYKKRENFITREKSTFINLGSQNFRKCVIKQLKDSEAYISMKICEGDTKEGIFDDKLYDWNNTLNLPIELDKKYIMKYKTNLNEHAMLLVGVDIENEKITKWKVKDNNIYMGKGGYFILSDSWFEKYVCTVVVNKKVIDEAILSGLKDKIIDIF